MAIRSLAMSAETFAAIGYPPSKLATVLNRADASGGFDKADVEQALGSQIDFEVVSDGRLVLSSNNEGVAFVDLQPGRRRSRRACAASPTPSPPTSASGRPPSRAAERPDGRPRRRRARSGSSTPASAA